MASASQLDEYLRLNMGSFSDITLKCEGKNFPANKIILAASSPYFSSLFSDLWQQEGDCSEATLPAVSAVGLAEVLRSLYGHPARLSLATVVQVVQAADFLQVASVTRTCEVFLSQSLVPGTVLRISNLARQFRLGGLEVECRDMVLSKFQEVAASEEFLLLEFTRLESILGDNRLVVSGEGVVWRAALAWLHGGDQGERAQYLKPLLTTVRYGLMDNSYFQEAVSNWGYLNPKEYPAAKGMLEEAGRYLDSMACPSRKLVDQMMHKYRTTPYFALPRLPQEFLFTMGGFTSSPSSSMEVYNSASDQWTLAGKKLKLPLGLAYCTAQVMGAKIFVMGGVSVDPLTHGGVVSRKTFVIDTNNSTIQSSIFMKERRNFLTSAVVKTTIYLFGGKGAGQVTSRLTSCEKLDTSKNPLNWERIQPLEYGRADAGAAAVGGSIYLVGGFDGASFLNSVLVYNPLLDRWGSGPSLTVARGGPGCVAHADTVYVAGGCDGNDARLKSVERLIPGARQWERVADMLQPRSNFCLLNMDGQIYAVGGFNGYGTTRGVERFDPEKNLWSEVSDLLMAKSGLAAVVVERRKLDVVTQRSFGSARRGELMERNFARALWKKEAEQEQHELQQLREQQEQQELHKLREQQTEDIISGSDTEDIMDISSE